MNLLINYRYFNFETFFKYIYDVNKELKTYYSYSKHDRYIEIVIIKCFNVEGFLVFDRVDINKYSLKKVELLDKYLTPKMQKLIDMSFDLLIKEDDLEDINKKIESKQYYNTR